MVLWILLCVGPFPHSPFPTRSVASAFYPAFYYAGSADTSGASAIHLDPGTTSPHLLLSPRAAGGSIAVQILDDRDGSPVTGILVEASVGRFHSYAKTDGAGRVLLTGVAPGTALVRTRPDDPRSETGAYAATSTASPIEVRNGAVSIAGELRLLRAGRIKTQVLRPSGAAWPSIPVVLRSVDGSLRRVLSTSEDGRANFGGLPPGAYRLWADTRGTEAVSEAWDGSRDTTASTPFEIEPGSLVSSVEIRPDVGAVISGIVRDQTANVGIPDAEVRVVAQQGSKETYTFRTDPLGFYFANGLARGSYKIFVPILLRWYPDATSEPAARPVAAIEGETVFGIDLAGDPIAACTLAPRLASAVSGTIRADFDIMPSATVVIWNEADTVRGVVREAGTYTVGCIPPGKYKVRCDPDGAYRTQYHVKTNSPDSAAVITMAASDTARAVDFEPQRSIVIEGDVRDEGTGQSLEGIPVIAMRGGRDRVETVSDAAGAFRFDRLPDGSGLPAGDWIVGTDSISVTEIAPTAIQTIEVDTERTGRLVRVRFRIPEDLAIADWFLERRCGDGDATVVVDASHHPEGTRARDFDDAGATGNCAYRLSVDLGPGAPGGRIESRWVSTRPPFRLPFPSPWNGQSVLRLPEPAMPGASCTLIAPDGSIAHSLRASGFEVPPPAGVPIPSGVYFLRWRAESGRDRTDRIVVKR